MLRNTFFLFFSFLFFLPFEGESSTRSACYMGEMSPQLCYEHLEEYPTTRKKFEELADFIHIIPTIRNSDSPNCTVCPSCQELVLRQNLDNYGRGAICPSCKKYSNKQLWKRCTGPCVNSGYFQNCNNLYFPFFKHFLQYCTENPDCQCYWPEHRSTAAYINQIAVGLPGFLADRHLLHSDFSPFWTENNCHWGKSLATHCFFYSQHRQICLDLAKYINRVASESRHKIRGLERIDHKLKVYSSTYLELYSDCIAKHPHPKIHYERGMIHMHMGNSEKALQDIRTLMELSTSDQYVDQNILTSEMYQQEGVAYADLGRYDKAIEALNKAISKDPNNFKAYFHRASAYFETGDFEHSLEDYIHSKKMDHSTPHHSAPKEFIEAFTLALLSGAYDSACEFVPSLCHTTYGMGKCLWAFGEHPIDSVANLAHASHEISSHVVAYMKTLDRAKLKRYSKELVKLYHNFNQLSDREKGELIGYTIGKYGVDIFSGSASIKCVSAFTKLKMANRICNFESMAISASSRKKMTTNALQQYSKRCHFFESKKILWSRQNRHIVGQNAYKEGRSILEHKDASRLLKNHAGTGRPVRGVIGEPGYKEIVDFKEYIGIWKTESRVTSPTTKGTIHYGKRGAHIVPADPNAPMW